MKGYLVASHLEFPASSGGARHEFDPSGLSLKSARAVTMVMDLDTGVWEELSPFPESMRERACPAWQSSAVGDVDGDGLPEIVVAVTFEMDSQNLRDLGQHPAPGRAAESGIGSGPLLAYFKRENGSWVFHPMSDRIGSATFLRTLSVGDVDSDGVDEVVVGTRPHGEVLLFKRTAGGFRQELIEAGTFGTGTTNVREVLIADADNDGENEILVATARESSGWDSTPGALLCFKRAGSAWRRQVLDDFGGRSHSRMLRVGPVGEYKDSCIIYNEVGIATSKEEVLSPSTMWLGRLAGGRFRKEAMSVLPRAIKCRGFALGDFDQDGMAEVVGGTRDYGIQHPAFLLRHKYDARGGSWIIEEIEEAPYLSYHAVSALDVDGDGQVEIVAYDDCRGRIMALERCHDAWRREILLERPQFIFGITLSHCRRISQ